MSVCPKGLPRCLVWSGGDEVAMQYAAQEKRACRGALTTTDRCRAARGLLKRNGAI